jgi:hypothetical protein
MKNRHIALAVFLHSGSAKLVQLFAHPASKDVRDRGL